MLDVVLAPGARPRARDRRARAGSRLRQGGSAATTAARWLGRLGRAIGSLDLRGRARRGRAGRWSRPCRATASTSARVRVAGARTGRIGVLVAPGGERSFVADRGAARPAARRTTSSPTGSRAPTPSTCRSTRCSAQPLGLAGRRAIELARAAGALVSASTSPRSAPLLAEGRRAALALIAAARPDLLFATRAEAEALLGVHEDDEALLELAPIAVVKRGRKGATVLARDGKRALRFEVATTPVEATDTTGAGDAFDAGFLLGWLDGRRRASRPPRRSSGAPWPATGPRSASCRTRRASSSSAELGSRAYARRKRSNQSSIRVIRSMRRSIRPVAWYDVVLLGVEDVLDGPAQCQRRATKNCSLSPDGQRSSASAWSISSGVWTLRHVAQRRLAPQVLDALGGRRVAHPRGAAVLRPGVAVRPGGDLVGDPVLRDGRAEAVGRPDEPVDHEPAVGQPEDAEALRVREPEPDDVVDRGVDVVGVDARPSRRAGAGSSRRPYEAEPRMFGSTTR